jgi:SAM-dependent methyltransferase
MSAPPTAAGIRDVNVRYHDAAAPDYDDKWGIGFDASGRDQVLAKLRKALGTRSLPTFARGLEIGAGTGYFALNLLRAGVLEDAVCTDLSPGMLDTLDANAQRLGVDVEFVVGDAERLPLQDESFDLVFGHAVLHHLPDLDRAFAEFHRVLRPGGRLAFAGEPSRYGDRLATVPKRGAAALAPLWRALMRAAATPAAPGTPAKGVNGRRPGGDHGIEFDVDVHAFAPRELHRLAVDAGFADVRVTGEELLASCFGWANRTLEASAQPDDVPWLWRQYAHRGYLLLQQVDRRLLEGRLPPQAFYNLMVAGRKPDDR